MRPGKITKSPLLIEPFGKARVYEIARSLRKLNLLPKGQKSISNTVSSPQAVVFLYLLASNAIPSTLRIHLDILSSLNDKEGTRFFNDFVNLFKDSQALAEVSEVEVSCNFHVAIFAIIRYKSGIETTYNSIPENSIRTSTRLSGEFLREFAFQLSSDFESAWIGSPSTNKNILKKNISCDSIQLIVDACAWSEKVEND